MSLHLRFSKVLRKTDRSCSRTRSPASQCDLLGSFYTLGRFECICGKKYSYYYSNNKGQIWLTLISIPLLQHRMDPRILGGDSRRIEQRLPDHFTHPPRNRILQLCPLCDRLVRYHRWVRLPLLPQPFTLSFFLNLFNINLIYSN